MITCNTTKQTQGGRLAAELWRRSFGVGAFRNRNRHGDRFVELSPSRLQRHDGAESRFVTENLFHHISIDWLSLPRETKHLNKKFDDYLPNTQKWACTCSPTLIFFVRAPSGNTACTWGTRVLLRTPPSGPIKWLSCFIRDTTAKYCGKSRVMMRHILFFSSSSGESSSVMIRNQIRSL